ncbi:MAG: PEP-CTERM sorting domain-containing protein [Verrucomicrobiales bacterium]|jgi:hypothetical protein|nr:PEP-CTERM sorting domain-containing protein [Verrucomicrobiales bacterium]
MTVRLTIRSGRGTIVSGWLPVIFSVLFILSARAAPTTEYGFLTGNEFVSSNGTSASNLQYTVTIGGITYGAGYSDRYNGTDLSKGRAAWLVNISVGNSSIVRLGLTGDEFTKNYGNHFEGYGTQASSVSALTAAGYLYGTSTEYHQGSGNNGTALWVATVSDPAAKRIGLYDYIDPADADTPASNEFTTNFGSHQSQVVTAGTALSITADGWFTGYSTRYNGGAVALGNAAWVANAATGVTHRVGLSAADADTTGEFTADNGTLTTTLDTTDLGKQAWADWGALLGTTARYTGAAAANGPAALWVAQVATGSTARLGLHDAPYIDIVSGSTITPHTYTSADGVNDTAIIGHTDSGLLWGRTLVYNNATDSAGQTAWLFDTAAFDTVAFDFSTGADGEKFSQLNGITADGLAFGYTTLFVDDLDLPALDLTISASRAFLWDADHGAHLLDATVLDGTVWQDFLERNNIAYLTDITAIIGSLGDLDSLSIFGTGYDLFGNWGQFELQLIPEPSTWALLVAGCGLLLILGVRRNGGKITNFKFQPPSKSQIAKSKFQTNATPKAAITRRFRFPSARKGESLTREKCGKGLVWARANSPLVEGWPRSGRGVSALVGNLEIGSWKLIETWSLKFGILTTLTLTALPSLPPAARAVELGPFSGGQATPGALDSGIPGFVGPAGDGSTDLSNYVNPVFVAWATGYVNYLPSPTELSGMWYGANDAIGEVTGNVAHVAVLGDMSAADLTAYLADPANAAVKPGTITMTFDHAITNGSGADFAVFENAFVSNFTIPETGGIAGQGFCELGYVEVSTDGLTFARFPNIYLNTATDFNLKFDANGNPLNFDYATMEVTTIYNLAGKHSNGYGTSYGTPFDLDTLVDISAAVEALDAMGIELTAEQLASLLAQAAYNQSLVDDGLLSLDNINFVRIVDIPGTGAFTDSLGNPIYDAWQTWGSGGFDLEAIGVLNQVPEPTAWALMVAGLLFTLSVRRNGGKIPNFKFQAPINLQSPKSKLQTNAELPSSDVWLLNNSPLVEGNCRCCIPSARKGH